MMWFKRFFCRHSFENRPVPGQGPAYLRPRMVVCVRCGKRKSSSKILKALGVLKYTFHKLWYRVGCLFGVHYYYTITKSVPLKKGRHGQVEVQVCAHCQKERKQ